MKLLHSLRSFRSTASVCDSEPSPRQWTSRFNPFSRWRKTSTNEDADSDIEEPSPTATLPPSTFDEAFSPFASSANSRPPSTTGSLSPVSSFGMSLNAFGAAPRRHGSVYSHRSLSIKRDASRPPSAIPRAPLMPRPPTPKESEEEEEEGLVLTATSRYPTGVAAELYIPEDCTYEEAARKKRENRRSLVTELSRGSSLIRRQSGMKSQEEKLRLKRVSVNF